MNPCHSQLGNQKLPGLIKNLQWNWALHKPEFGSDDVKTGSLIYPFLIIEHELVDFVLMSGCFFIVRSMMEFLLLEFRTSANEMYTSLSWDEQRVNDIQINQIWQLPGISIRKGRCLK